MRRPALKRGRAIHIKEQPAGRTDVENEWGIFRVGDQVRERKGKVAGDEIGGLRVADKAR